MNNTSLYIHVPFCLHRCGYCDFNTYAGMQSLIPAYAEAVGKELEVIHDSVTEKLSIHTIYLGGGTPTLLPEKEISSIIEAANRYFNVATGVEISLEANPGTVSLEYLNHLHQLGVRRISLGMQSANQEELVMLERQHTFSDVVQAVEWTRAVGINNINLDLIYGLPRQTLKRWSSSIEAAIALHPEHLSLYALTLEKGTPMQSLVESGQLPKPSDDLAADMYEYAEVRLAESGYEQYEISNWARRDESGELISCKHNLQYWRNLPYIGVGAGAHGFVNHYRTIDELMPAKYIKRMKPAEKHKSNTVFPQTPATIECSYIDQEMEIGETMMMGLRLVDEGISRRDFKLRFGIDLESRYSTEIARFTSLGLLEWSGEYAERLRLTKKGYLLGNQVFMDFI